jgi:hypothetical protein
LDAGINHFPTYSSFFKSHCPQKLSLSLSLSLSRE